MYDDWAFFLTARKWKEWIAAREALDHVEEKFDDKIERARQEKILEATLRDDREPQWDMASEEFMDEMDVVYRREVHLSYLVMGTTREEWVQAMECYRRAGRVIVA